MKLSSQILLAFSIVVVLSVIDSITNYLLSVKVRDNTAFLNNSEAIIRNSGKLHKSIIEMQSAFRGFLLTDDANFLDNYDKGIKEVPGLFSEQHQLVKSDTKQLPILDSIYTVHLRWIEYANSLIAARKNRTTSGSAFEVYNRLFEEKLKQQVGKKMNDEITRMFLEFDRSEYALRIVHGAKLTSSIDRTHTFSFFFLGLTIIVGIGSAIYIVMLISTRIKTMVHLAENISKGEFATMTDVRNDELTRLSHALNIMSDKLSKNIQELERRNEELDKFAHVVSHDLKAPIRGIHNVTNWIEEDLGKEMSPQMKQYLSIIPQKTKRMEDLINGLLDYA
ncbi:MAG TPA: CHASE3 domain-containing protein, partial [Chitinophagaceae bacterium]